MRTRFVAITVVAGLAVIGAWLYLAGCDNDSPTGPVPPKDYPVYFTDINDTTSFIYTPATGTIDSFHLPFKVDFRRDGMRSTADGRQLYVSTRDSTMVLDLATGELSMFSSDGAREVAFSADGQLMAIQGDELSIVRTSDQSLVYFDTSATSWGVFSANSQSFYAVSNYAAYKVSLDSSFAVTRKSFGTLYRILPSIDECKWFLIVGGGIGYCFGVYDPVADSVVFWDSCSPGFGDMALTPDNRYLFFAKPTDCRDMFPDWIPSIVAFDVENNRIHTEINPIGFYFYNGDSISVDLDIADLQITPDGRWLVGIEAGCLGSLGLFVALDIDQLSVARHERVGTFRRVDCLTGPISP